MWCSARRRLGRNASFGSSLTVTGNVSNGSNLLSISGTGDTTISGVIGGGTGGLMKEGSGALTLTGANAYTGATMIHGGSLTIGPGNRGSINSSPAISLYNNATLTL